MVEFHATTICAVKRGDDVCIGGDGQVTMGETAIFKNGAKKVKKIYKNTVLTGFAGSVADAFSLTEKFESKLDEHGGNLKRAAVALAQIWRSDKAGIGYATKAMLDELGATTDDTEGVINIIRNIKGVEIAAFLKEKNDAIKVSLRAKTDGDVQQIATMFEGGGHKKAAGCTLYKDMQEAVELMKKEISKSLEM